jgi:hypothetical protein
MATFTASAAALTSNFIYNVNGTTSRCIRYTHPIALSAGDVIQMVRIANGTVVTRVAFGCSASAGAITVNCGDGNDTSAYAASVVLSGSVVSVAMPYRGNGRSYSAEDTIDLVVTALSAVPGTVDLFLTVDYTAQNGG